MRLFIAINFTSEEKNAIIAQRELLREQSSDGNFSRDENLHMTLEFIGETPAKSVPLLLDAIRSVKFTPFTIILDKIGFFTNRNSDLQDPKLYWIGPSRQKEIRNLQKRLHYGLEEKKMAPENGRFTPHITLGRQVISQVQPHSIVPIECMASKISLMKSERINGKLTYTEIMQPE